MAGDVLRVEAVKVKDLYTFACEIYEKKEKTEVIPIGKQRALAWTRNPYADDTDVGLLVAYVKDECVGYLGIMPGLLRSGGRLWKVYWISTWYVAPEYRKTGAGALLIMKALGLGYDLAVTEMSPEAANVYSGFGFKRLRTLEYYALQLNCLNGVWLAARIVRKLLQIVGIGWEIQKKGGAFSRCIYRPVLNILYGMVLNGTKAKADNIVYKEVGEIPECVEQYTDEGIGDHFYRSREVINWMLADKWPKEVALAETADANYHFAALRDVFEYKGLLLLSREQDQCDGFVILSFSLQGGSSVLKVLDFGARREEVKGYIAYLAVDFGKIYGAECIEMPNDIARYVGRSVIGRMLLRKRQRVYFTKPRKRKSAFAGPGNSILLTYCDGDTAFT